MWSALFSDKLEISSDPTFVFDSQRSRSIRQEDIEFYKAVEVSEVRGSDLHNYPLEGPVSLKDVNGVMHLFRAVLDPRVCANLVSEAILKLLGLQAEEVHGIPHKGGEAADHAVPGSSAVGRIKLDFFLMRGGKGQLPSRRFKADFDIAKGYGSDVILGREFCLRHARSLNEPKWKCGSCKRLFLD